MRATIRTICLLVIVGSAAAEIARADLFNIRPRVPLSNGSEPTLQQVLDSITPGGPGSIDAVEDQIDNAIFRSFGDDSAARMVIELAGFAGKNTFGIYSFTNPSRRATIFNGAATSGDVATIVFDDSGDVAVQVGGRATMFADLFAPGGDHDFGFFMTTPQHRAFFTEDSRNPLGRPQALIYQGDDRTQVNVAGNAQTFDSDDFIIAFEDLAYASSDRDFQDMVVLVQSIMPVPAPGAAALGVLGLCLAGWIRRRPG